MKRFYKKIYQIILLCAVVQALTISLQAQYEFLQEKKSVIVFQPADGSLENGCYYQATQQAHTNNGIYNSIVIIPKTQSGPSLNNQGLLETHDHQFLYPVGTFAYFSEKLGNTTYYCIFGKKIDNLTKNQQE